MFRARILSLKAQEKCAVSYCRSNETENKGHRIHTDNNHLHSKSVNFSRLMWLLFWISRNV